MTGANIRTRVLYNLGNRTDKNTQAIVWINHAIWDMYHHPVYIFRALEGSDTLTTVANTYSYSLPSDYETFFSVKVLDGERYYPLREYTKRVHEELFRTLETSDTGRPERYFTWATAMLLSPTPDAAYVTSRYYLKKYAEITETTEPIFGDEYVPAIVAGATALGFAELQEPDDASAWAQRFSYMLKLKYTSEQRGLVRRDIPLTESDLEYSSNPAYDPFIREWN